MNSVFRWRGSLRVPWCAGAAFLPRDLRVGVAAVRFFAACQCRCGACRRHAVRGLFADDEQDDGEGETEEEAGGGTEDEVERGVGRGDVVGNGGDVVDDDPA